MAKRKRHSGLLTGLMLLAIIVGFVAWMAYTNLCIGFTRYELDFAALPEAFDGFTVAQISDWHNADFGGAQDAAIERLKLEAPDLIALTGDLVDANHTDIDAALAFVETIIDIAPCCYITGNHEGWLDDRDYAAMESSLKQLGVTVLHNEAVAFRRDGAEIALVGLDDPGFGSRLSAKQIDSLSPEGVFTVLLSHRPEYFEAYVRSGADLILSGHVHGGQFRLPFVGGVIGPYYTFFPQYDAGLFRDGDSVMVVSRGLGNSVVPVRFNNQPEIVLISLKSQ